MPPHRLPLSRAKASTVHFDFVFQEVVKHEAKVQKGSHFIVFVFPASWVPVIYCRNV